MYCLPGSKISLVITPRNGGPKSATGRCPEPILGSRNPGPVAAMPTLCLHSNGFRRGMHHS